MPLGIDAQREFTIRGTFSMDMSNKRGISNGSGANARGDSARYNDREKPFEKCNGRYCRLTVPVIAGIWMNR